MEPNKSLDKLKFTTNKPTQIDGWHYILEVPLGDTMFRWLVASEIPTETNISSFDVYDYRIPNNGSSIVIKLKEILEGDYNEFFNRLTNPIYYSNKINTTLMYNRSDVIIFRWDLFGCLISEVGGVMDDNFNIDLGMTLHYDRFNKIIINE
jgi:hypothetical protein